MTYMNGFAFHPQSGLNDAVAAAAPAAGQAVGTYFGHPAVGAAVGNVLAEAARQIPLPVATHTGPIGTVISTVAPHLGASIGNVLGYPNAGAHLGNIVGEAAHYLPFSAGPQVVLAPQGVLGSVIGALAPKVGGLVGGLVGHPNAGAQIGTIAGGLAHLLPFSAEPQITLAPQGVFGDLVGAFAPKVGGLVGNLVGHPNAGAQIGTIAGHLGSLLPFSAGPQITLAPQGVFGDLVGALAPKVGGLVGGLVGHPNAGAQIGTIAGHLGGLLPFSAGPQIALAPQGVLGHIGHLLPFAAQPAAVYA